MMLRQWIVFAWLVLVCSCTGHEKEGQKSGVRPLFISFSNCLNPPFSPRITVEDYRQHVLKQLFKVFRHRHPDEGTGIAQVASACTQAAALIETYRSVRKGYLDYQGTKEIASGMAEDAPAWLAARLDLMLRQDATLEHDQDLKKNVKWCREACLTMQQMLSQRAFSEFVEKPSSPGNAFNNLLEASQAGDGSHTERVSQFLLAKCRDERTEPAAQNHVWAALSVGLVEQFFLQQLRCGISAQQGTEEGLSLIKALLTLSWGNLNASELTASHDLLMDCVEKIDTSRLLTDSDKTRIKKNCLAVAHPQFQPFWPFYKDPLYYDEALLAMYSMPQENAEKTEQGGEPDSPPQSRQRSADNPEQEAPSAGGLPQNGYDDSTSPQEHVPPPTSSGDTQPATTDEEHPHDAGDKKPLPTTPGDTQSAATDEEHPQGAGDGEPKARVAGPPSDDSGGEHSQSPSPPAEPEAESEPEQPAKPPIAPMPVPLPKPQQDEPSEPKELPSPRVSPPQQLADEEPSPPSPVVVVPMPMKKGEEETGTGDDSPKSPSLSPKKLPKRIHVRSAKGRGTGAGEGEPSHPLERKPSDLYRRQREVAPQTRPNYVYGHRIMVIGEPTTKHAAVHHHKGGRQRLNSI
ncbi:hypothetical protein Esti_005528 [Eimeria stiedai]